MDNSTDNPNIKANNIIAVVQAHNHNYQKEIVSDILSGVFGTGTHDVGSKYSCDSKTDQNGVPALCITGENGITILDLQINNTSSKHIDGWC